MQIEIRSKSKAKEFSPDVCWAAISISTYSDEYAKLSGCKRMGLLQQAFYDLSMPSLGYPGVPLFTEELAEEILKFVDSVKDNIEVLLVHCEAGVSRSPAIAAAIDRIFCGLESARPYFQKYRPNILVYQTILHVAEKQGRIKLNGEEKDRCQLLEDCSRFQENRILREEFKHQGDNTFCEEVPLEVIEDKEPVSLDELANMMGMKNDT